MHVLKWIFIGISNKLNIDHNGFVLHPFDQNSDVAE